MTTKRKTRKAPAAKAKATISSDDQAATAGDFEAASKEANCDNFIPLFADWLVARADIDQPRVDSTDEGDNARSDRAKNLARLVTTTPAPHPWMVWQKFEVLEPYLNFYGEGTTWTYTRELVMLAGIKADLVGILKSNG